MGKKKGKKGGKTKKSKRIKIAYVDSSELGILSLALRVVTEEKQKISTALIMRRLKVGYAQAAHLLDRLEELAVITPTRGKNLPALTGYVPVLEAKGPVLYKETQKKQEPKKERTTSYNEKIVKVICDRLAGGESVLQMCKDEHMPAARTVYMWLLDVSGKRDFIDRYEAAKLVQAEAMHDELLNIADSANQDYALDENGEPTQINHENINRSRLRVDTRKWLLARMNPKKYGDKIDVTSGQKPIREPRPVAINYIVPAAPKTA